MERGRVVQVGSYDELAEAPGPFRELVEQDARGATSGSGLALHGTS
jgi:ABC-type transport system involved in cytochrome bd biosynthesis fused ATPase/permease subunit